MNTTATNAALKGVNKGRIVEYTLEQFIKDASEYVKAIKERRMINSIGSVSKSGMSRTLKFLSCESSERGYYYRNYFTFFKANGFSPVKDSDYFRVNGCGMDMVFHTNYSIIHNLEQFGIITKEECDKLAQMTPITI